MKKVTDMINRAKNSIVKSISILWAYLKFQIVTKGLISLMILPAFSMVIDKLIASSNRVSISSGDYLSFLMSFQGLGMLLISILLTAILIGLDINAFIYISACAKENKEYLSTKALILIAIKSLISFTNPVGLVVMLYVAVILPLIGFGIGISPMSDFQIPNFITSVIYSTPLYLTLYLTLIAILMLITFVYVFTLHFMIIRGDRIQAALKHSASLMRKYWLHFLKDFVLWNLLVFFMITLVISGLAYALLLISEKVQYDIFYYRTSIFIILLLIAQIVAVVFLLTTPVIIHRLTTLFYRYHEKENDPVTCVIDFDKIEVSSKKTRRRALKLLSVSICLLLLFNVGFSMLLSAFFEEFFHIERQIEIIAHRGGGDLGAENTIDSLEKAIVHDVTWSEIDVQRTKDGAYIINHDNTFKRLSGVSKKSSQMNLSEIKELKVKNQFEPAEPSQPVATLEEFLVSAKGKIGLFVELKGETADQKMVDDVVKMILEHDMKEECVLLSLNYKLIEYIEEKYPDFDSGYLYYFAIGDFKSMKGDYLIMEEREATDSRVEAIKNAGKKAIVWTVNTDDSIQTFINSDVDGIITDYVGKLQEAIKMNKNRSDFEIIIDSIF